MFLFSISVGTVFYLANSDMLASLADVPDTAFGVIFLFLWTLVESVFLCIWGTTPGKIMLKVRIEKSNGEKIRFKEAINRSLQLWVNGWGTGLPIVSLICLAMSYRKLKTSGETSWDERTGFTISHDDIGWFRIIVVTLFFLLCLGVVLLDVFAGAT